MENLSQIGTIKELLARHGFTFSKALGQNFIVNPSVCPRMAEQSGARPGAGVIEIGAGIGVLTCELARRAEKVVVVELDERLFPILHETLRDFSNIKLLHNDILKVDVAALIREEFPGMPVVICANLPYYITSPILMGLLEARLPVESITVMVQKEAAQRICAPEGTRDVGAISLAVRYYSSPSVLFQVSRGSFLPAPEVDSTVIRLDLRPAPSLAPEAERQLFRVIRGAFSQRRKTAVNSVSSALGLSKSQVAAALQSAGLSPSVRPEQLALSQFQLLTEKLFFPKEI